MSKIQRIHWDLWPKQMEALETPATELLFGGASRGGKSHFARVALIVWCLAIPNLSCTLIRKKHQDILDNHVFGKNGFKDLLKVLIDRGEATVTQEAVSFKNGSRIVFKHCFAGDTEILTTEGPKTIKSLLGKEGYVNVAPGVKTPFRNVRKTQSNAPIVKVIFNDGSSCRCTPDHRFLTTEGWVEAQNLKGKRCVTNKSPLLVIQNKSSLESSIEYTARKNITAVGAGFIESFGNITTDLFLKTTRYITRTIIEPIIKLVISNCLKCQSIELCTPIGPSLKQKPESILLRDKKQQSNGTQVQKGMSGISSSTIKSNICLGQRLREIAISVSNRMKLETPASIAVQNVGRPIIERLESLRSIRLVRFVLKSIKRISIDLLQRVVWVVAISFKPKRCVSVAADGYEDVYCLTAPEFECFPLFNHVLTHNCQDERQFDSAQGVASNVLFIDEATQISEKLIRTFRGWCTITEEVKASLPEHLKGKFPRIIYTANPIGVSVGFFRRHFVKARAPGAIDYVDGFYRQYIPSRVQDNASEDAAAAKGRLTGLNDAALATALIEGDWDAPVGDFFPEWDDRKHVVDDFIPPKHWHRYRCFDWGTSEPFAVTWWCVSDGESFTDDSNRTRWYPRGARICYREWYGCQLDDPAKGSGLRNPEIASGILARSEPGFEKVVTLTDSLPFQDRGNEFNIAEIFANSGVILTQAALARPQGWSVLRGLLQGIWIDADDIERTPLIYCTRCCTYSIEYLPALPRHPTKPEDAAESGEATHISDTWRYSAMNRAVPFDIDKPDFDPRKSWTPTFLSNIPTFDRALEIIRKAKQPKSNW